VEPTSGRRLITLGGRALASVSAERSLVNVVRATSADGLPAIDVLAGLAARDPSGLVFIGDGTHGLAFALEQGHITSAYGTEPRGSMSSWSSCASPEDMKVWVEDEQHPSLELLRAFIQRCVLDRLSLGTQTGSILTVVRGDVRWLGASLERSRAPKLQRVLMEHARETDELRRLGTHMGLTTWVASRGTPPDSPAAPRPTLRAVAEDETSFGDLAPLTDTDASPLALLSAVWRMCDGETTVDELARRSVFGRSSTLRALWELKGRDNIAFTAPAKTLPPAARMM
ncbi:MAG: hypothetical protein KUG77_19815, partial [Nannocystaceae bacterium]|nr:hypothetical protein [Nannocystaceae bacterium]